MNKEEVDWRKGTDCGIKRSLAQDNVWSRAMGNMVVPGESEKALESSPERHHANFTALTGAHPGCNPNQS